ncbi:hypothetical protein I8F96_14285 [Enterococcus casseliflavus]|nr:hypothetical protein [Enterococcus casseliflavus]
MKKSFEKSWHRFDSADRHTVLVLLMWQHNSGIKKLVHSPLLGETVCSIGVPANMCKRRPVTICGIKKRCDASFFQTISFFHFHFL